MDKSIKSYVINLINEHKDITRKIKVITDSINNKLYKQTFNDELLIMYHQVKIMNLYKDCIEDRLKLNNIVVSDNDYVAIVDSLND